MNTPSYEHILLEVEEPIATIRFDRPEKLNAFNPQLQHEVIDALARLEQEEGVRAAILTGAGRAFSAGFDIGKSDQDESELTPLQWRERMEGSSFRYARSVWEFKKPLIAATHGYCLGGACEIAMLCDLTISSDDCQFGEPEIRFGTGSPALIMPWIVPMKVAKELLYTGKLIGAQRAYELGMVNEVVAGDQLEKRARYHALVMSKVPPLALRLTKEGLNKTYEIMGLLNALAYNGTLVPIVNGSETEEFQEFEKVRGEQGLRAALAWRNSQFEELEELG